MSQDYFSYFFHFQLLLAFTQRTNTGKIPTKLFRFVKKNKDFFKIVILHHQTIEPLQTQGDSEMTCTKITVQQSTKCIQQNSIESIKIHEIRARYFLHTGIKIISPMCLQQELLVYHHSVSFQLQVSIYTGYDWQEPQQNLTFRV